MEPINEESNVWGVLAAAFVAALLACAFLMALRWGDPARPPCNPNVPAVARVADCRP